jgi:uncharacterized RDD family membrane protein YckC
MAIDLGVLTALIAGANSLAQVVTLLLPPSLWVTSAIAAAIVAVSSIMPFLYFFLLVAVIGRTLGKAVMGIRVVSRAGTRLSVARSFLRAVAYVVSLAPLFAGFFWVLVDSDRRAWHDRIAGSRVVYDRTPGS